MIKDVSKVHKSLSKVLRNIGSTEPHTGLQNTLFLFGQKHEQLEKEREIFSKYEKECKASLQQSKKLIVTPLRVRV